MTLNWETLATYVGADYTQEAALTRLLELAKALVDGLLDGSRLVNELKPVPAVVLDECYLQVAAELFDRSQTPSSGQYTPEGGVQLRVSRDPLRPAYGILRRWVVPF